MISRDNAAVNDSALLDIVMDDSLNRQETMEKTEEVFNNTPRSMWFRLLNKKDEKGHGVLQYYVKAYKDLLYIEEHLKQTLEGKTYLTLIKAITKKDYKSCKAILEALSVDADMLSGILSFTNKFQQTVLMQAVDALYKVVDHWEDIFNNQKEPDRKQRLTNAWDLEDRRKRLVKKDIRTDEEVSIEKEFEERKAIVQLLLTYCKKLDSNTWKYIVSVCDIVCDNVLTKATQTGDVNLVKEIFDMIPEGGGNA